MTVAVLAVGAAWAIRIAPYTSPEAAMHSFLSHQAQAEEQLLDPLLLSIGPVAPLVEQHLASHAEPMRPWAAAYLGVAGRRESLSLLASIVRDASEHSQTRAYALASVQRLDPATGSAMAAEFASDSQWLGQVASAIVAGHELPVFSRSYLEALLGWRS